MVKKLFAMLEMRVPSLGWEDPLEKEMATEIPLTEEPGRPLSIGSQRVRHDLVIKQQRPLLLPSLLLPLPHHHPCQHLLLPPSLVITAATTMTKISNRELSLDSLAKHCCKCFACIHSLNSYKNSEEVFKYH